MYSFVRVWGFLKYYHPSIGGGKADADLVFMAWIEKVRAVKNDREYAAILEDMRKSLGAVPVIPAKPAPAKLLVLNDKTAWINTDKLLPLSMRSLMQQLRKHGYTDSVHLYLPAKFYDTEIPAEKPYDAIRYPNVDFQLLALARYWNAIEYLFPYKYLITRDWNNVLKEQLPFFARPMSAVDFEKHLLILNASIEDTHGGIVAIKQASAVYGSFFPPFIFKFAGDSIVVTDYIDSAGCREQDIRKGDLILGVRGKDIARAMHDYEKIVSASNLTKKRSLLAEIPLLFPFRGDDSLVSIKLSRGGKTWTRQLTMQRSTGNVFAENINRLYREQTGNGSTTKNDFVLRSINKDVALIDAARLSILYNNSEDDKAIDSVLSLMRFHQKAVLLDLRCYATQAVFYNKFIAAMGGALRPFAELHAHYTRFPGRYYNQDIYSSIKPGQPKRAEYPGKLILLVNEETRSQSELITMILQKIGIHTTVVGSQTAGCDGDLIYLPMPGGYQLSFSGRHVAYPDGKATQKVGVRRDVKVKITAKGLAESRDEILETALKLVD